MRPSTTTWGPAGALLLLGLAGAGFALPGPSPAKDDLGPRIKTGIEGQCLVQVLPGIPTAKLLPPQPRAGVKVRIVPVGEKKAVAEATSNAAGRFRVAVPPGRYRVEVVSIPVPAVRPPPSDVTVQEGKLAPVRFQLVLPMR